MRKVSRLMLTTIVLSITILALSSCSGSQRVKTAEEVQKILMDNGWDVYTGFDDKGKPDYFFVSKKDGKNILHAHDLQDEEKYGIGYADYNILKAPLPVSESSWDQSERARYQENGEGAKQQFQDIEKSYKAWLEGMKLTKDDMSTLIQWVKENAAEEKPLPLSES